MNLLYRILTVVALLPFVVYCFYLGGPFLLTLLSAVFLICSTEFATIVFGPEKRLKVISVLFSVLLFASFLLLQRPPIFILILFIVFASFNIFFLFKSKVSDILFQKLSAAFFCQQYLALGVVSVFHLREGNSLLTPHDGLAFVYLMCLTTWGNDTLAYFGGRLFGKHALMPSVSPKKTWEGFFCGAFGSFFVPVLLDFILKCFHISVFDNISTVDFFCVIVPSMFLAPAGDLWESRFKRLYNVKDSSHVLPGHGGFLDRIDAILLVGPWTLAYAFFLRPLW